ncbi:hypothetical protein F2P81_009019 [Scophthalmus maximus]|uniref:Uncharacterized protein n=1 Tax=Scophthalmus maximus TaxID=52904 RepID=A0A6A4T0G8_SCOMX|nr:hypothetical protein F2P81_009019 [Scophthalmus maximus]
MQTRAVDKRPVDKTETFAIMQTPELTVIKLQGHEKRMDKPKGKPLTMTVIASQKCSCSRESSQGNRQTASKSPPTTPFATFEEVNVLCQVGAFSHQNPSAEVKQRWNRLEQAGYQLSSLCAS